MATAFFLATGFLLGAAFFLATGFLLGAAFFFAVFLMAMFFKELILIKNFPTYVHSLINEPI